MPRKIDNPKLSFNLCYFYYQLDSVYWGKLENDVNDEKIERIDNIQIDWLGSRLAELFGNVEINSTSFQEE
ncbi:MULTISPECIES: hypothetical protein [unclassified Thermoactinomyces]|uniref:hypothetical protein n=1 Tax=unclassified Thermoactinomyces TaxID=2634588 RepID=UPI0018DCA5CB|nr:MULTISPECIES: hypothetical protein [unclassified Thermoactinomyces]MBH8599322.1 hypothetical protein [Thermoactinomyces sp. CICC 10523]MBH8605322.1 hypothetical protein [Thermoactinomyces sp. CICC 10522]